MRAEGRRRAAARLWGGKRARPRDWRGRAAAFGLGLLIASGFAPFTLPVLPFLAIPAAMAFCLVADPRRCAFRGWWLGLGYFGLALHWIVEPFLVDVARHGWMAPFALLLMAGGLALLWAAAFWGAAWVARGQGRLARGLALAVALGGVEMLRGSLFGGFPWALVGSLWAETPLLPLAGVAGVHGLTVWTLALAAGIAGLRAAPRWPAAALVASLAALAGFGWLSLPPAVPTPVGAPVIRVVQPNEAQALKWRPDMIQVFWDRKLALTAAAPQIAGRPPAAIVWPEVSMPYMLGTNDAADAMIAEMADGAPVILGAQREEGNGLRNSLAVIGGGGAIRAIYDKHHLVPFGEYLPLQSLWSRFALSGLATDSLGAFSPGPGPAILALGGPLGTILPLICYEAIFPRHASLPGARPDWIVQVTNDAWFGRWAGPQQHLNIARLRAAEQGVPLVRSANTGISAVIGPRGAVLGRIPLDTAGLLDVVLPPALAPTPYARTGNIPLLVALLGAGLVLAVRRRRGVDLSMPPG